MLVKVYPFAGATEDAQHLGRSVAGGPEPVGHLSVELGCLAGAEDEVLVAEHQPHLSGQHVQPLEPVVGARGRFGLGAWDDDLPRLDSAGSRQREHGAAVDATRLESDARVADLRCAHEVVDGHPVGLREREQQLQARSSLPVLEPRQCALRDARPLGRLGEREPSFLAHPTQPRAYPVQRGRDDDSCVRRVSLNAGLGGFGGGVRGRRRGWHGPIERLIPGIGNKRCRIGNTPRTLGDMNEHESNPGPSITVSDAATAVPAAGAAAFDVVIVGGGAAGLSAALVLTRARRRVAVVDSGQPRNAPASHMQGFIGSDGLPPAELLAAGREEVVGYGGHLISGAVAAITACVQTSVHERRAFTATLEDGYELRARRVLVTTGLRDEVPDVPGVRERWGRDVLHCPYCHGYEVRDQPLCVLADADGDKESLDQALAHAHLVRQWSDDVVFFANGHTVSAAAREQLVARAIGFVPEQVTRLVVDADRLTGVELAGGRVVPRSAVFVRPRFVPNDRLLADLGCATDAAGWVAVDGTGRTSVAGVWAAGNAVNPRAQVITAAGEGSAAAIAINNDLVEEDLPVAVTNFRHGLPVS